MRLGSTGHCERQGLRRRDGAIGSQAREAGVSWRPTARRKFVPSYFVPAFVPNQTAFGASLRAAAMSGHPSPSRSPIARP